MDSACWMKLWQGALYLKTLLTTKGNTQQAAWTMLICPQAG